MKTINKIVIAIIVIVLLGIAGFCIYKQVNPDLKLEVQLKSVKSEDMEYDFSAGEHVTGYVAPPDISISTTEEELSKLYEKAETFILTFRIYDNKGNITYANSLTHNKELETKCDHTINTSTSYDSIYSGIVLEAGVEYDAQFELEIGKKKYKSNIMTFKFDDESYYFYTYKVM